MSKSLIIAIMASLVPRLVKPSRTCSGGLRRSLVRKLHPLLSAVFQCPSDVYRARGAHGQVCLRDSTLSSARPAPDQCARRQHAGDDIPLVTAFACRQSPKRAPTSTTLREPCSYSFRLYDQSVTAVTDVSLVSL